MVVFMVVLDKAWSMCSLPCWSAQLAPIRGAQRHQDRDRGSPELSTAGLRSSGLRMVSGRSLGLARALPEPPMAAVAPCSPPQSLPPPMRIGPDWPPGQILSLGTPKCTSQTKLRLFIEFCVSASVRRCKALDHLIKVGFGLLLFLPQIGAKMTAGTFQTHNFFYKFFDLCESPNSD